MDFRALHPYRLFFGGVPAQASRDDIKWWVYSFSGIWTDAIQIVSRSTDATMKSCFLGYSVSAAATEVLRLLPEKQFWGTRPTYGCTVSLGPDSRAGNSDLNSLHRLRPNETKSPSSPAPTVLVKPSEAGQAGAQPGGAGPQRPEEAAS